MSKLIHEEFGTSDKERAGILNFVTNRKTEMLTVVKLLKLETLGIEKPVPFIGHLILAYASESKRKGYDTHNLFMNVLGDVLDDHLAAPVAASAVLKVARVAFNSRLRKELTRRYFNCADDHLLGRMLA